MQADSLPSDLSGKLAPKDEYKWLNLPSEMNLGIKTPGPRRLAFIAIALVGLFIVSFPDLSLSLPWTGHHLGSLIREHWSSEPALQSEKYILTSFLRIYGFVRKRSCSWVRWTVMLTGYAKKYWGTLMSP